MMPCPIDYLQHGGSAMPISARKFRGIQLRNEIPNCPATDSLNHLLAMVVVSMKTVNLTWAPFCKRFTRYREIRTQTTCFQWIGRSATGCVFPFGNSGSQGRFLFATRQQNRSSK